jgi:hypothetical protein
MVKNVLLYRYQSTTDCDPFIVTCQTAISLTRKPFALRLSISRLEELDSLGKWTGRHRAPHHINYSFSSQHEDVNGHVSQSRQSIKIEVETRDSRRSRSKIVAPQLTQNWHLNGVGRVAAVFWTLGRN